MRPPSLKSTKVGVGDERHGAIFLGRHVLQVESGQRSIGLIVDAAVLDRAKEGEPVGIAILIRHLSTPPSI